MSVLSRVTTAWLMLAPVLASPLGAQARFQFASTGGRPPLLERPARLEVREAPLAVGLMELQRNSGVALAFSPSLLRGMPPVTCLCRAVTVGEALDRMLAGIPLTYEELAGQILVEPVRAPATMVADAAPMGSGALPPVLAPVAAESPSAPVEEPAPAVSNGSFQPWAARLDIVGVATGTVRGTVVEAGSDKPLSGVQVYVPGTGHGALTNAAGMYVIGSVPVGAHQVRAEMLGYATMTHPVTVAADQPVTVDFALAAAAITLDQMVVTGVPGSTSKRTLGNAITTINVADVADKVTNANVTQLLQAKAPGVSVMSSSGSPGTAGDIRIRGVSSLAASSFPVIYIDGVRIYAGPTGAFRNNWMAPAAGQVSTGGQTSYALDAINPADIESIEVIKGPAAATLYGADAANGVIQIITKKGKPGQQKLQWNAKVESGQRAWALDTRTTYTTCTAAMVNDPTWGGADGKSGCLNQPVGTVLSADFLKNGLQNGQMQNLSLSVRGGGDGYSFFVAGENALDNGVFANSWDRRAAFRSNFSFYPSEQVDFAVNVGYNRSQTRFPSTDNGSSVMSSAWGYQPGRTPGPLQEYGYGAATPAVLSVYDNRILSDRVTLGTTLNYRPFHWLKNRVVVGGDINSRQANRYVPPGSPFSPVEGQMTQGMPRDNLYSVDYAGTITTPLPFTGATSALSFGMQYIDRESRNTVAQGTGYPTDAVQNVASAQTRISWDEFLSVKSLGFFGQEQLTFKDRLYLTGALRVDNSSVFGADVSQLYYPKLSAAYVISDAAYFRRYTWLNNLKLRAAWGQAGNAPDPFARTTSYSLAQVVPPCMGAAGACAPGSTYGSGAYLTAMGNPNVKPERGDEIELGLDAGILNNRAGIELTFYNKKTRNALMPVPFTGGPSAGFSGSILQNVGEIGNKGVELSLTATPLQARMVTWDARLGLATNSNKLIKFGYSADTLFYGLTTTNQRTVPGYPLAGYWVHDPVFNATRNAYDAGPAHYLGPSMPTREISFSNTVTIHGNFQLFALLDYKGGNYLLDQTGATLCEQGLCKDVNDPGVSATRKAMLEADLPANDALYTYRADFIKFRDLSLTYTFPASWANRLHSDRTSLTVAGHNLGFLWKPYYKGLDPEVTFNGVNDPKEDGQAFGWVRADYFTVPMTRSITASINVTF